MLVFIFGEHEVVLADLVDQAEHLARRGLSVVVEANHDIAADKMEARHDRGMLTEVAREVDAEHLGILAAKRLDTAHHVVGRAVVDKDDLIIIAAVSGHGIDDLLDNDRNGLFRAVAGNDK